MGVHCWEKHPLFVYKSLKNIKSYYTFQQWKIKIASLFSLHYSTSTSTFPTLRNCHFSVSKYFIFSVHFFLSKGNKWSYKKTNKQTNQHSNVWMWLRKSYHTPKTDLNNLLSQQKAARLTNISDRMMELFSFTQAFPV